MPGPLVYCLAITKHALTKIVSSLVPKKGQVMLEMANLLCGPEVLKNPGGMTSSPRGTPNGRRTRNSLLPINNHFM